MTAGPTPDLTLPWVRSGTAEFLLALAGYGEDLTPPSRLPGWDVAHVVAHVARNADALGRLSAWAATGVETPMYSGPEQRSAEIEAGAHRPATEQLADVNETAARLDDAMAALPADAWEALVRSAKGRTIPATEIPWLRAREVWLHAVDIGADPGQLPASLVAALLDDACGIMAARPESVSLRLVAPDREWVIGTGDLEVRGTAVRLLLWLTGRDDGAGLEASSALPALPPFL